MPNLFHPELHAPFEALGYLAGYLLYRRARTLHGDTLPGDCRWVVIAAAAVGALLGSRILGLAEQAPTLGLHWRDLLVPGGKTIVGGLLGGWLAVEIAKRLSGIRTHTGDLFAVPLCLGIAIGRIGCFLAGLPDDTYGTPTSMPWESTSATASPATPPSSMRSPSSSPSPGSSIAGAVAPTPKASYSAPS